MSRIPKKIEATLLMILNVHLTSCSLISRTFAHSRKSSLVTFSKRLNKPKEDPQQRVMTHFDCQHPSTSLSTASLKMQDSLERCPVGRKETAMGNSPKKHHTWAHETLMCTRFRSFRMCLSETLVGTRTQEHALL